MEQDLSHLEGVSAAGAIIADVKAKVKHMRGLEKEMLEAERVFKMAKEEYEKYKATVVTAAMTNAGISKLEDEDGSFIKLESKYYCNPNKNDADRLIINNWLRSVGLDYLIKHKGEVAPEQLDALRAAGVPFAEKSDLNTNSLKAALIDLLGYKAGSMARISLEDIPDQIHFFIQQEVVTG